MAPSLQALHSSGWLYDFAAIAILGKLCQILIGEVKVFSFITNEFDFV